MTKPSELAQLAQAAGELLFGKGPTRADEKAAARQHRNRVIRSVREQVMRRDRACRVCHTAKASEGSEMHELVSRALRRGQAPEEIFNTANCLRLCRKCHGKVTRHEIWLDVLDLARGANGTVVAGRREP